MQIYHYADNGEFLGSSQAKLNPLETKTQGQDVFLIPANATLIPPPVAGENEKPVFDPATDKWIVAADFRGTTYYLADGTKIEVAELGIAVPENAILIPLAAKYLKPYWNGEAWIETALIYQSQVVATKADVDAITRQRIIDLGEEKAKTEKLLAGESPCPVWNEFVAQRAIILAEGEVFIADGELSA